MAINPQRLEDEYQFWATTDGFGRKVQDAGGDGGPRRGGKAKYSLSQVFDDSGETLTETNIDEDGSETKVVQKTPSSLLDNESYDTPILGNDEVTFPSIATPPEEDDNFVYGSGGSSSGRWGGPARAGFMGPTATRPYGPLPNGRYLTEDEYLGADQASRWLSRPSTESIESDVFGTGIDVEQSGSDILNDQGTLAITDEDRANAQSSVIESINNQRMMELYNSRPDLYEKVVEGELDMPVIEDPHKDKDYTTSGFDGSSLHSDSVPGSFISETFDRYRNEDGVIVDSPIRSDVFDEDNPLFTTLHPEAAREVTEEKIQEEEKELEKNFDDLPWAGDKGIDLTAVVQEIKDTDPKAIEVLNEFASWADTVTDEVAIKEAENYLLSLKNSPSVDSRFRKAMAIGMIAMLFGDDFTTAMNTGFGVVADDYTAEAEAAKTEAEAAAELAKTIAKEGRANAENDRRKMRDFTLEMAKTRAELGVKAAEDLEAEIKARAGNNQDYISKEASHYESILTDDQKKTLGVFNFGAQYDRALQFVKKAQPDVVWDLKNNNDQRVAFDTQFQKWLSDKLNGNNFGQGVPAFANYMQDAFIKTQLEGESILNMKDTNPSLYDLQQMGIDTDKIDFGAGMEATNAAYTKIEDYSTGFNERGTLALMAKDYYDWQKSDPDAHKDMVRRANEQGIGGFIWYVTRHVEPTDTIGTKYDPLAVGKDNEWRSDFAIQYLRKEGIIVTPTK
jgi:hypothetical protein